MVWAAKLAALMDVFIAAGLGVELGFEVRGGERYCETSVSITLRKIAAQNHSPYSGVISIDIMGWTPTLAALMDIFITAGLVVELGFEVRGGVSD